jgi:threonyl-tRNA synthetase
VGFVRKLFDIASQYNPQKMTEDQWLRRTIFLETIAGVPGMVGGMMRHMRSLRTMKKDHGWIHHLLEEAENERMHLFIFLYLR